MKNVTSKSMTYRELQDFIEQVPISASARVNISFDEKSAMNKLLTFLQKNTAIANQDKSANVSIVNACADFSENSTPERNASESNLNDTPHDFSKFEAFGIWADRDEMADSVEYVRKIRQPRF